MRPATTRSLARIDGRAIPSTTHEVRAFLVVRNERRRLPPILDHHRALGVSRFFVVDNASVDGTATLAASQPDVHLFHTTADYRAANLGLDWISALLDDYGRDGWNVVIDADELLVYPGHERVRLPDFCATLEARGVNCLPTMFVDLYGAGPIATTRLRDGQTLLECCPYFDGAGYVSLPIPGSVLPRRFGGPRARLFWPDLDPARAHQAMTDAAASAFDEEAYLAQHPDVRVAVAGGDLASGLDHYRQYGWLEARTVAVHDVAGWPEAGYLGGHRDVRDAVERHELSSGLEHYVRFGQFEGRLLADWPPCLTQVPVLRWDGSLSLLAGRHGLGGARWPSPHVIGGALLHFRLMADAAERARLAAAGVPGHPPAAAWGAENRRYAARLAADPGLSAMGSLAVRYSGIEGLVARGLVHPVGSS